MEKMREEVSEETTKKVREETEKKVIRNMLAESYTKDQIKKILKATDEEIAEVEKEMLVM